MSDAVDRIVEQWRAERADLPLDAMATLGRLGRLAALAGPRIDEVFARFDLTHGEFDVLAALRRSGSPFTLTPTLLARTVMLSPAAMTNRLDRLENAGLVVREIDPGNRRSIRVSLTEAGRTRVDEAVTEHVANEERLLSTLSAADRRRLDDILRRLLAGLETL
ncbi:MarR family winged helix-turn-helix transcriptional regulator [Pseudonocardia sp. N23]|uniref:MarR family winged helix-turn-helix transcriptional regulator n=1 Tax=Pseudonocardia sp. N23 TaxID=1987376 RepID=UPI000BFE1251|nr:MarR family transcriptional regulator [Pseudonocardia sp. N23]GAY12302.1 transcriptional regulator, MarR family [Pseudonocardia sp. N23]